jgi:hypothetical protein
MDVDPSPRPRAVTGRDRVRTLLRCCHPFSQVGGGMRLPELATMALGAWGPRIDKMLSL